jgi:tRNA-modifying protein YgfZ
MTTHHVSSVAAAGYAAALEGVAYHDASAKGRVWLRERDRADLLHRLSTNNIVALGEGQGARTVLTNHNGRIIDLLTVCALPERLLLLCSEGQGPAVARLLRKNIFFNDKVGVEDATTATCELQLYGPQVARVAHEALGVDLALLPLFGVREVVVGAAAVTLVRTLPLGGDGLIVMAEAAHATELAALLAAAGAQPLSAAALDTLRVEAGYGSFGRELSLEYIPLETGLRDAISFNKGCYVGQEIIARMDSRGRMAKRLCGLRLSAPVEAPGKLAVAGKEAGDLTSVVLSPRFGPIALAYVRTAHAEAGTVVGVANSDATGEVVALPFG